jgi:peroxiredoxin
VAEPVSLERHPTTLALIAVVAAALVVTGWLSMSLSRRGLGVPGEGPIGRFERAPAFSLRSLRGAEQIALADFRGKTVVLNFFASWCAPCKLEAADLQRSWQEYEARGEVMFLGVAIQDEYSAAKAFLDQHGMTYAAVFDAGSTMMTAYRITGIPTTVVLDAGGRIVYRYAGTFVGDAGRARLRSRIDAARRVK